jgi:RNA polymerase sigma factor (sigma-70 family)
MAIGQSDAVLVRPQSMRDARTVVVVGDGELLARFTADRDELAETAFAALVRRHGPMVLRICYQILGDRHTAEDAFQATFLVLARRAGSIHQPELLGHWLHGVALRTAREARMRDHRRRRRESPRPDGSLAEPVDDTVPPERLLACREEFDALHEEVSRLPERYRVPVVLCDLEGLTYQEAANRLRCPVGTIGVRLKRARERLRLRLTHRGLAPTAGLIGTLLGADAATASLPAALVDSTAQAAIGFAANAAATSGLVSTSVVTLTESVLKTMAITRLKLALGIAIAVGIATTAGWIAGHRQTRLLTAGRHVNPISQAEAIAPMLAAAPQGAPSGQVVEVAPSGQRAAAQRVIANLTDKVPPPGNLLAFAVSGRAILSPEAVVRIDEQPPIAASLSSSNSQLDYQSAKDGYRKASPENAAATITNRTPRNEQEWGEMLFAKEWVPNDPTSRGGDGLGPLYNDTSCVACHGLGGTGGAGPESKNVVIVTAIPNGCGTSQSLDDVHPGFKGTRSIVLHRYATDPAYASWRRRFFHLEGGDQPKSPGKDREDTIIARINSVRLETAGDRQMRSKTPNLPNMGGFNFNVSERNTPALFGAGPIDEIPSEVIVAAAKEQRPEVRGRVSRTREGQVGRFGWKAQISSLHGFVRSACANEIGLQVRGHAQAKSPLAPGKNAKGYDMTDRECDALVAYVRALPAPVVVDPAGLQGTEDIRAGRRLFAELKCTSCHMPALGEVQGIYSDLLLHDMGQSLSDSASNYGSQNPALPNGPTPREWRTPPLWGYRDSGPYLHDGRAQNLEEAVALHEGQGKASSHAFFGLSASKRAQVEAFLKSLIAPMSPSAPGVRLAGEMESRFEQDARTVPEAFARKQREADLERDEKQFREEERRQIAETFAKRARVQIKSAEALERMGKISGALSYYRNIAQKASGTDVGRLAAARAIALSSVVEAAFP